MVTLGQSFKMGVICNWWAYFGHSRSKHSECAQFLTIGHIVDPLRRTFKMYPIFNHWVHCGQVLSVPTMYSPCAHWVYGSLSPVGVVLGSDGPELIRARDIGCWWQQWGWPGWGRGQCGHWCVSIREYEAANICSKGEGFGGADGGGEGGWSWGAVQQDGLGVTRELEWAQLQHIRVAGLSQDDSPDNYW